MAAVIIVPLFQTARLGAVPGFLVAGVIVGPSGLSLISKVSEIGHLAEIGIVLLLFVIGIELKPSRLWLMRKYVFGLGTLQVVITGLLLAGVSYFFFNNSLRASILIGPALALSSTAFVLQLLTENKLLATQYGRTSISILLLQDLAVVPLLALLPLLAMTELSVGEDIGIALVESLLIVILVVVIGRYFLHPILHRVALSKNSEIFTASAVLIVIGAAVLTEHAGLSMAMGAFLAGLLISDSFYRHQVMAEIQPFRGLLLGLFFMSMGMSLNLNMFLESPLTSIGYVSLLILLKAMILIPLAFLFKIKKKNCIAAGLVLAQSGEFALVIFSLAHENSLLSDILFQQLLLVVLLSMMVTPVLSEIANRIINRSGAEHIKQDEPIEEAPIVLAGYGRVGRRIGSILTSAGKAFVALDVDPKIVEVERKKGSPVFFGDVRKPELLKSAGAENAKIIIVSLNDESATESVVATLHKNYPDKNIFARGSTLRECCKLRSLGATGAVSENIEASLELANLALESIGYDELEKNALLSDYRNSYQKQMDECNLE